MEFPLKADFFPQVRLSNEERRVYLHTVEESVRALRKSLDEQDWKKSLDKHGVSLGKVHCIEEQGLMASSRSFSKSVSACIAVCASVFTAGTISEVLEAIASPVTEDYRKAMAFLYKEKFLDGICLHTIVPNGSRNAQAFTTMKWCAFDDGKGMNSPQFSVGTDYCFLEHAGIQKEEHKDEVFGFCVQESIVRDREIPSLAGLGLRRGEFHRTGIIVTATERKDVVQVTSILQLSLSNREITSNRAFLEKVMQRRVSAIGRLELLLERRRLSKMQFIPRTEWVADEARKACAVCVKPFALRRKHHCRNCGEVVCSSCAPPREVDVSSYGVAHIRICTACVVQARTGNQQAHTQDVFMYHIRSTVSSRSSTISSNVTVGEFERRRSSASSDSNFSISSDSGHSIDDSSFHEPGMPKLRNSSMSNSSSCSLSDLNVLDEDSSPFSSAGSSSSMAPKKHVLYTPDLERETLTADLTRDTCASMDPGQFGADDDMSRRSHRSSSSACSNASAGSLRDLLASIREMKADLSAVSHMYGDGAARNGNAPPHPALGSHRSNSISSFPSTVDIDMLTDGSISLVCPETASQADFTSMRDTCVSSISSTNSVTAEEEDSDAQTQVELQSLQQQVEQLHRSLEDATNKLNYYQARTMVKQHVDSVERGVLNLGRRQSTAVDPFIIKRKQGYNALISELHEIMGLPALNARDSANDANDEENLSKAA